MSVFTVTTAWSALARVSLSMVSANQRQLPLKRVGFYTSKPMVSALIVPFEQTVPWFAGVLEPFFVATDTRVCIKCRLVIARFLNHQ